MNKIVDKMYPATEKIATGLFLFLLLLLTPIIGIFGAILLNRSDSLVSNIIGIFLAFYPVIIIFNLIKLCDRYNKITSFVNKITKIWLMFLVMFFAISLIVSQF